MVPRLGNNNSVKAYGLFWSGFVTGEDWKSRGLAAFSSI